MNIARRAILLLEALRRSPKPHANAAAWFPTTDQIERAIKDLQALIDAEEEAMLDSNQEELLRSLGLDPASPDAWRNEFELLARQHCGAGKK
jgi:hypothetical protein